MCQTHFASLSNDFYQLFYTSYSAKDSKSYFLYTMPNQIQILDNRDIDLTVDYHFYAHTVLYITHNIQQFCGQF
jgi:hypothetical protein